jgi:hypothetical protein
MGRLDAAAATALGGEIEDRPAIATVCCYIIHACKRARDYDRGTQWCERLKDLTTRWDYRSMLESCRMQYAGVLICRGEWRAAEAGLTAGSEPLARVRPAMSRSALPRLAELRRRQGRWEEATELFRRIDHTPPRSPAMFRRRGRSIRPQRTAVRDGPGSSRFGARARRAGPVWARDGHCREERPAVRSR